MTVNAPRRNKKRKWVVPVVTAIIGAIGVVVAALFSNSSATIDVITGSAPSAKATVTITPQPVAKATVTITAGPVPTDPGPITLAGCTTSRDCKAYNIVVPLGSYGGGTGIDLSAGAARLDSGGDLIYGQTQNGTGELTSYGSNIPYSTGVTAPQANHTGCEALTTSDPDNQPITNFHVGLKFCVATDFTEAGYALVTQTRPVGSNGTLYLQEYFWAAQNN